MNVAVVSHKERRQSWRPNWKDTPLCSDVSRARPFPPSSEPPRRGHPKRICSRKGHHEEATYVAGAIPQTSRSIMCKAGHGSGATLWITSSRFSDLSL